MRIPLRNVLLSALVLSTSTATPTFEHERSLIQQQTPEHTSGSTFSRISRLCSGIIQKIWPEHRRTKNKPADIHTLYTSSNDFHTQYGDDVVLRFKIKTAEEAREFTQAADILYLDIWDSTNDWVDVRISKKILPSFLGLLPASLQNAYTPLISDLSGAVYGTYPSQSVRSRWHHPDMPTDLFFENYQPLSVLYPWLRQMALMFPDRAQLFTIGKSNQGRDIPAMRVGVERNDDNSDIDQPRHTVVIIAGSHAREWISVSTAAYILRRLIHNYAGGPESSIIEKLLTHYDIIFVPIMNPDGYEYTWSTDRLWRKNRQQTSLPFCPGIDLDRAFPMGWNGRNDTDNPCMESYAGQQPLQATEAKVLYDWALNETNSGNRLFQGFLDLHSYSQKILYPYSYTCDRTPPNLEDLEEIAIGLAKSFRVSTGHYYDVDSACEGSVTLTHKSNDKVKTHTRVEGSGGSALDFFYQDLRVKYAFQIKLRDTGTYGFLLPRENIVPTGREAFGAVIGFGRWLLGNRGIEDVGQPSKAWDVNEKTDESESLKSVDQVYEGDEYEIFNEDAAEEQEWIQLDLRRRRRR